jgi:hypothetical protein
LWKHIKANEMSAEPIDFQSSNFSSVNYRRPFLCTNEIDVNVNVFSMKQHYDVKIHTNNLTSNGGVIVFDIRRCNCV